MDYSVREPLLSDIRMNGKEATVNRAIDGSTYPG